MAFFHRKSRAAVGGIVLTQCVHGILWAGLIMLTYGAGPLDVARELCGGVRRMVYCFTSISLAHILVLDDVEDVIARTGTRARDSVFC